MKIIILAAGSGNRLRPHTITRPKCMVEFRGRPLLHWQLSVLEQCSVPTEDIAIVGGYLQDQITPKNIKQYSNLNFAKTNMVHTLFCAREHMATDEDLIISYGDIVFSPKVFENLLAQEGEIIVSADLDWEKLWSLRMENPLDDAETFKLLDGQLVELGKRPQSHHDIAAQYIGLIRIPSCNVSEFISHYDSMDTEKLYDGQEFENMYMTSMIQNLIDCGWNAQPALFRGGWLEVDSCDDLKAYQNRLNITDRLDIIIE